MDNDDIIYFDEYPKEIVLANYRTIKAGFNPKIHMEVFNGLSISSDEEQIRIRNRVLSILYPYECPEGKKQILECMSEPAPFSEVKEKD